MKNHSGLIVEKAVRRSGVSITELARKLNVDRKSLYNWFHQENLNVETIARIGHFLNFDFSKDFPDYNFDDLIQKHKQHNTASAATDDLGYWKVKYIELLEKYNSVLTSHIYT